MPSSAPFISEGSTDVETSIRIALISSEELDVSYQQEIVQALSLVQLTRGPPQKEQQSLQQQRSLVKSSSIITTFQQIATITDEREVACPTSCPSTDRCVDVSVRVSLPVSVNNEDDPLPKLNAAIEDGTLQRLIQEGVLSEDIVA